MKYIYLVILIMLTGSLIGAEAVDYIVAKVGREVILKSDLEMQKVQMQQLGMMQPGMSDMEIINEMVESRLILQTAKDRNYRLDEYRIRQLIDNQINGQISRFGSEATLREELRKAGMSLSDLRDYYDQMIREQRLKEMIVQNEIMNRIHVTEAEVDEYYQENLGELPVRSEKVEIGMIRKDITASDRTKRRVLTEVNRVYDRIREGEDFGNLARETSDCPSAQRRGDLGFFGPGTMIKEFEEVAFALKPGEISRVVETQFGYHIIKMEERDEDDIRVRHILKMIEPTEDDVEQVINYIDNVLIRLRKGENFAEMATANSDDESAVRGGVIGEFSETEYPEMFKSYIEMLNVGEYSEVIREGNTLYIFGKLRTVPERPFRLDEIKDELREHLLTTKQIEYFDRWISNLRNNSYVEILVN